MKACTACGSERDTGASRCRKCLAAYKRELRGRDIEKARKYLRNWYAKNRDKALANAKKNYLKHKDGFITRAKKWRKENPAKVSKIMIFQNAKRRSRLEANGGRGFEKSHWLELLNRFKHKCAYCVTTRANSIDHFVPLKRDGPHDFANIVPACLKCNGTKRDNEPESWIIEKFGAERLAAIRIRML